MPTDSKNTVRIEIKDIARTRECVKTVSESRL